MLEIFLNVERTFSKRKLFYQRKQKKKKTTTLWKFIEYLNNQSVIINSFILPLTG